MEWYTKIVQTDKDDPIYEAIVYFNAEYEEARKEIASNGLIEREAYLLPQIVTKRYGQLQEIEAILKLLNMRLGKIESKLYRQYFEHYNHSLKQRDIEKYIQGESEYIDMAEIVNLVGLIRNKWLGITKGLEYKHFQITNIVKLRVANMESEIIYHE
ncbi:MAG: hypothetical protein WC284_08460 [Candidimonas sp.]